MRSFDLEITCMISAQIALPSISSITIINHSNFDLYLAVTAIFVKFQLLFSQSSWPVFNSTLTSETLKVTNI